MGRTQSQDRTVSRLLWIILGLLISGLRRAVSSEERENPIPSANRPHWLQYAGFVASGFGVLFAALAAIFTGWQAYISRDVEKRQFRPYLFIEAPPKDNNRPTTRLVNYAKDQIIRAQMEFENEGQTPAYDLRSRLKVKVENVPLPDEFDFSEGTLLLDVAIGPHARFTPNINSNEVLTEEDIQNIGNGRKAVYVYGRIDYEDGFRTKHWTNFCVLYNGNLWALDADVPTPTHIRYVAGYCPIHNEVDRD